jgi:acyl-CoA reductase-like NAD-dependent aldehyde dehydrogenase
MEVRNPANDEIIQELEIDTIESIQDKYHIAKEALNGWKKTSVSERVACIARYGELLKEQIEEIAGILTSEMGKPLQESRNEIAGTIGKLKFFVDQSEELLKTKVIRVDGNTTESLAYEPLGVIANISAWNYPYLVGVNTYIAALACGNSVLYKPSEFSSLSGIKMGELLEEAGIPKGVFQIVLGERQAGEAILELPLQGYFFTGSYATGKYIAEKVASKLVPVGLELGGKDPLYITDEVEDLASAAASAVEGAFYNNGQSCCAIERIYVHQNVYDSFLEHFKKSLETLAVGDPMDSATTQGPLARKAHIPFLEQQVKDANSKGAKLLCGGKAIKGTGAYFEPTAFINVNHDMSLMTEESFGPIIGVMKVKDDEEAARLMNDTEYGLTAAVFSSNQKRAENIVGQLNSGTGYINCCDRVSGFLPWSGRQNSGLGSTLSHLGLYAFCAPKALQYRSL